ncbi:hypothetical protein WIS52_09335 [Pseudonocardia nematodicida]|uniref:Integral membrane protein n=1 Tax=Pseudonocardia nematodicida TaxID=1206997 RepID=A0ABV1K902_9PSEU
MDGALSFYQNLSTVSFTLLGLWFTVLGLTHGGWRSDPLMHRSTLHVALHFFLPGLMGLVSVLAAGNALMWRITFAVLGLVGALEALAFLRYRRAATARIVRLLRTIDPLLYVLVVVAALVQGSPLGLAPLQVEGIVTGLLFVVGMSYLWFAFAQRLPAPPPTGAPMAGPPADGVPGVSDGRGGGTPRPAHGP